MVYVLDCLIAYKMPELREHLSTIGVDLELFLPQWIIPLFSNDFKPEIFNRLIDLIFCVGPRIIYPVILAILMETDRQEPIRNKSTSLFC